MSIFPSIAIYFFPHMIPHFVFPTLVPRALTAMETKKMMIKELTASVYLLFPRSLQKHCFLRSNWETCSPNITGRHQIPHPSFVKQRDRFSVKYRAFLKAWKAIAWKKFQKMFYGVKFCLNFRISFLSVANLQLTSCKLKTSFLSQTFQRENNFTFPSL